MFSINGNQLFTWYKIFLIIGLDKSFPFLFDIKFPLHREYRKIQSISQDFVKKVFDNKLKLFEVDKPSQISEALFEEVYILLTQQIGDENTKSFCKWGNALKLDTEIEYKLLIFWDNLMERWNISDDGSNNLKMLSLQMLTNRYKHYLRGIFNAQDDAEIIQRSEWDELAYNLYYRIGDSESELNTPTFMSPLDFLEGIITYCSLLDLLTQLRTIPNVEDLLARLGLDKAYIEIEQLLA